MQSFPILSVMKSTGLASGLILTILAFLSLGVWGVILLKYLHYKKVRKLNRNFLSKVDSIDRFIQLADVCRESPSCPLQQVALEIVEEARKFSPFVSFNSLNTRSELLEEAIQRSVEILRLEEGRYLSFLALSSNLSPFLGLMGTVWGIMSAFHAIGQQGSAELSVVAPGIAAALITTLAGLIVAIPASAGYNVLVARTNRDEVFYFNFGSRILSLFKHGDLKVLEDLSTKS